MRGVTRNRTQQTNGGGINLLELMYFTPRLRVSELLLALQELITGEVSITNHVNLRLDCSIRLNYVCIAPFKHSEKIYTSGIDPAMNFKML